MKYPWYIWLSIIGFIGCSAVVAYKIVFVYRPFDFRLWVKFCLKFAYLLFGMIMLPIFVLLSICNFFNILNDFVLIGIWLCIYFLGIMATKSIHHWHTNSF